MSTSSTRSTPSPTTLGSGPGGSSPGGGKNFKIFNRHHTRDRSKSLNENAGSSYTSGSESAASSTAKRSPVSAVKRSKLFGVRERDERASMSVADVSQLADDAPTIVEPASPSTSATSSDNHGPSTARTRRPQTSSADLSYSGSNTRMADIPSRLSGWFSHTFSGSTTDLSLPALLSSSAGLSASVPSPKGKASGLLTAARHGKGHLDKAMRYLLDSDATPDKSTEPIWLLGVSHPGYEAPPSPTPATPPPLIHRRNSTDSRRPPHTPLHSNSSSASSTSQINPQLAPPPQSQLATVQAPLSPTHKQAAAWPTAFYADFTSRVWLTYRSQFSPIHDCPLSACKGKDLESLDANPPKRSFWPGSGEKTWTSDAGWGCMLRTGQSLLANTLIHLHLGRDWRRPAINSASPEFATYVKILTWFFDAPSSLAPFSVHRMAMSGKDFGKDVGQWFGPSTAAGAIKTLVHDFPRAQLGVAIAVDGVLYETDIYSASHYPMSSADARRASGFKRHAGRWGNRAVLVLVATRLGLDGVNPIYYENLKTIFTFPQSLGIAGGRPSSSYYFVGSQGNSLFYLDPHHTRPAVPLRTPPPGDEDAPFPFPSSSYSATSSTLSGLPRSSSASSSSFSLPYAETKRPRWERHSSPPAEASAAPSAFRSPTASTRSSSNQSNQSAYEDSGSARRASVIDDPLLAHYGLAYSMTDLRTFHCDRVRKMPLSGLDPSMLLGFLCRDEQDWKDFRRRMAEISKGRDTLFSIQEEPPSWPSDSDDMGLESLSEPDIDMPPDSDEELADAPPEELVDSPADEHDQSRILAGLDDEPQTPLPGSRKQHSAPKVEVTRAPRDEEEEDDDDEWLDPQEDYAAATQQEPAPQQSSKHHQQQRSPWPLTTNGSSGATTPTANRMGSAPAGTFPFPTSSTENIEETDRETRRSRRLSTKARTLDSATIAKVSAAAASMAPGAPIPDYSQMRSIRMRNGGRTKSGGVKGVFPIDDRSGDSS